jgi:hypothetical protein
MSQVEYDKETQARVMGNIAFCRICNHTHFLIRPVGTFMTTDAASKAKRQMSKLGRCLNKDCKCRNIKPAGRLKRR